MSFLACCRRKRWHGRGRRKKSAMLSHRCEGVNVAGTSATTHRCRRLCPTIREQKREISMRWSAIVCAALVAVGGAPAGAQVFRSSAGDLKVETVAKGLDHPWSIAFLPDGRMLVTERPGRMRIVTKDGKLSPPLAGVPSVFASGQGGLLDVALDRGYGANQTIYFCYAEPASGGARTALARARLLDEGTPRLDD